MRLPRAFESLSIRGKLTAVIMTACALSLVAAAGLQLAASYTRAQGNVREDLRIVARIMAKECASALEFDDETYATSALRAFEADPSIVSAAIYDAKGHLFACYDRDGLESPRVPSSLRVGTTAPAQTGEIAIMEEILGEGAVCGSVYVRSDLREVGQRVWWTTRMLGLVFPAVLVLAWVLASRMRGLISDPIIALAGTAHRVRHERDYGLRMKEHSDDELGELIEAFNEMLDTIQRRDDELQSHRENLEAEVAQRTEELVDARDSAEKAARVKSEFMANMSHEIRTPMNGVLGMASLMLETGLNDNQRQMMETVKSCGDQLLVIINDVLDFSKIEAGKLQLEVIDFDLRAIVEELGDVFAPQAEEKGVELLCLVHSTVPALLRGDPSRIRQVLLNLLSNALKFTEQGEVFVDVTCVEENETHAQIRLAIRDTGIGIPADRMDQLFESFSQVDASMTRKFGGTGLGLAISNRLVEAMGGRITAESEVGVGSVFAATLELQKQAAGQLGLSCLPSSLQGLKVAVIDDNALNRQILCRQLVSWGCQATAYSGPRAGLQGLEEAVRGEHPFDFLLVDCQMPGMDGLTLVRILRQRPHLAELPIVMLTSLSFRGQTARLEESGLNGYLTKPVKQTQLYDCVVTVLGARRKRQEEDTFPRRLVTEHSLVRTDIRKQTRILLVEDNVVNQRVASAILGKGGYVCEVAHNGREGLEAIERGEFDVVLMDCQMPVMDGYEATRRVREMETKSGGHIPIVAMTANALEGDQERCMAAGMDDYVSKPVNGQRLLAIVERWILWSNEERERSA